MTEKTEKKKKGITVKVPSINPWMVLTVILAGALAFVLAGGWTLTGQVVSPDGLTGILTAEEAANKAIDWLSSFYNGQGVDVTITLVNANETENGIYQFTVELSSSQGEGEQTYYVSKDGKLFIPQVIETEELVPEAPEQPTPETPEEAEVTVGGFSVSEDPVCEDNGKPIIYMFGSSGCPHCTWLHPVFDNIKQNFGDLISVHDNMDESEADREVYNKYGTGYIPMTVIGCKYYRTGTNNERTDDIKLEEDEITALICTLTDNQPTDVCNEVKNLIEQV